MSNHLPLAAELACLALLGGVAAAGPAAPPKPAPAAAKVPPPAPRPKEVPLADRIRSPHEADRALADKLRSPRETLKTLYFAVTMYDLFPQMMDDAVGCLDLDAVKPRPAADSAALAALDLEQVLATLALPLADVPDEGVGDAAVLYDGDGFRLSVRRGCDGGWRFDAETLGRLPAMRRAAAERRRRRDADTAGLRDGFTDPRATLRQFASDVAHGDFYAAARALDLGALGADERSKQGPALAQQLAFVQQRVGFVFRQEVPDRPDGPPYTWHADKSGRIALERVRQPDGKDAWLFSRQTVRNVPRMYAAVRAAAPDPRYVRLGIVVPAVEAKAGPAARKRPDEVPAHLGSPRALLRGFFRTMDAAERNDARLLDALEYLDLDGVPAADRASLGTKLAAKLEAVLRKLPIDLSAVPDDWDAPPQVLGEAQDVRVEIVRQRCGYWCFSAATVARTPALFERLAAQARSEAGHGGSLDSPREVVTAFLAAARRPDFTLAAHCLDLAEIHPSARDEIGPALAFKLKYALDRIGRVYVQEVPDKPDGPRYILYRGEWGRVVLNRAADGPAKGQWQFTGETVRNIEPMFRAVLGQPPADPGDGAEVGPRFAETPGPWLRLRLPEWAQLKVGRLDLYQWPGLLLAALASWLAARVAMAVVTRAVGWLLRRGGSAISVGFVGSTLRPLTWLAAVWVLFRLLAGLDLPVGVAGTVFALETFLLAGLGGWLGVRLMDLAMAIYTNTERLRPHRNLGDMIVPVSVRLGKAAVLLVVATYLVYQVGEVDLLGRFLTGLGVAGLAASLAAQDALKSYFGTLLLIGERAFQIGDRILVGGKEGVVEQVGFRSTRLRTAEDSLLTVPNAVIAAAPIDNMGARTYRRFATTVVVHPDSPAERILAFRDRVREWLDAQPLVVRDKTDVHVHQLTEAGVELSVSLFLAARSSAEETQLREAATCELLRLATELNVGVGPAGAKAAEDDGKPGRSRYAA